MSAGVDLVARTPIKCGGRRIAEGEAFTASPEVADELVATGAAEPKAEPRRRPAHKGEPLDA